MAFHQPFTIYNAAAGAGKTYTLVRNYLLQLLMGDFVDAYKSILAITFTNKAVAEMKNRILNTLVGISISETPSPFDDLINDLSRGTGMDTDTLKNKATRILKSIIHNYAGFDVVTIDTFTHRIIRTFAHDLSIPVNFEVEMDVASLLEEAIDSLVSKIGNDQELSATILDFALSKLDDDKSWDITLELNKIGKLLFSENDKAHLDKISDKTPREFKNLKKSVDKKIIELKKSIVSNSQKILQLIHENGIENKDFTRSSIPNHFDKLTKGNTDPDYKAAWKQNISTADFYNKTLVDSKKDIIDRIRPEIETAFLETKKQIFEVSFLKNIKKNLIPLSVLNAIHKELLAIKKERRIILITEFNTIISNAIQGQPAPFIYERLGERYRDYFIDEFQDTSALQWNNLIPLIDNAIATETLSGKRGQLTIVGDAKQAIYRWRGGKAEQFIGLSKQENPFSIEEKVVSDLPKNYRSHQEIIQFNNDFFTFIANDFSSEVHKELYIKGNQQEFNTKEGGCVSLSFLQATTKEEENKLYPQRVYETIETLYKKGYASSDICILTRKQKEGVIIADYLTEKGVDIISSETLLIANAIEVNFIIDILTYVNKRDAVVAKVNLLRFLGEKFSVTDPHGFIKRYLSEKDHLLEIELKTQGVDFNFKRIATLSLYEAVEYCLRSFDFNDKATAHLQFFMDVVFEFGQKHTSGISGFLDYWEEKKEVLSIVASTTKNAVRIMTIHKSKGLEFPCVIYPFADENIYNELDPKDWYGVDAEAYEGFNEVFINYSKNIAEYGPEGEALVLQRQSQQELDSINILYVVLTRAIEQLYIISNYRSTAKGVVNENTFSGKFVNYLKYKNSWQDSKFDYFFGNANKETLVGANEMDSEKTVTYSKLLSSDKESHHIYIVTNGNKIWDAANLQAKDKGVLIHELMAEIYTAKDIDKVLKKAKGRGVISGDQYAEIYLLLKKLIIHPELEHFFGEDKIVMNERDIISQGVQFRPDRVVIDQHNRASLLDYKTGTYQDIHKDQLLQYGKLLKKLGYQIEEQILVYMGENITLKHL